MVSLLAISSGLDCVQDLSDISWWFYGGMMTAYGLSDLEPLVLSDKARSSHTYEMTRP